MECEHCTTVLKSQSSLNYHQKTAKYCLKLQGKNIKENTDLHCSVDGCTRVFMLPACLKKHEEICKNKSISVAELQEHIKILEKELELSKKERDSWKEQFKNFIREMLRNDDNSKDDEYDEENNQIQRDNIEKTAKINMSKKQPRVQHKEMYVIYIITTDRLEKDRVYILGRTNNLTSRLSTYNKSDEHKVIFKISCDDKKKMKFIETLVFERLTKYRERPNRERFILPEEDDINLFIEEVKRCRDFICSC